MLAARYADVDNKKFNGATYTPEILADFVAKQILNVFEFPKKGVVRVLDPACGDGALLDALIRNIPKPVRKRLIIVGFDTDPTAVELATQNLRDSFPDLNFHVEQKDFLKYVLNLQDADIFSVEEPLVPFDLVIANPPYVRTQVLGATQAQKLAESFDLKGRIDLYYPFILGISVVLDEKGSVGVITSNRFMTTKGGQSIRREMLKRFEILSIWDLGDTKIFDAAVLPSVFIAKGSSCKSLTKVEDISFSTIYETKDKPTAKSSDVLTVLKEASGTVTEVPDGKNFRVLHGILANGDNPEGVWRISTKNTDEWLDTVAKNTWDTFRRIGKIRVGVKSTADKVFLRSDWDTLPSGRPELLKPLITRKCANRFKAVIPENPKHRKEILYPHEMTENGRSAINLDLYPKSATYLEEHKEALSSRKYLIEAGRNWYELWVPQNPAAWSLPKLVFPDISEKPVFWIDMDGGVVNGECYWLQPSRDNEKDLMWLALAVGNSSFIETFYDCCFNNKLYAGKRRFITQYVELFPLPNPYTSSAIEIINLTKEIYAKTPSEEAGDLYLELDNRIWEIFGLNGKKVAG